LQVVVFKTRLGEVVTHVPLLIVKAYAPWILESLVKEISETSQLQIYTHTFKCCTIYAHHIRDWVSWLMERKIRLCNRAIGHGLMFACMAGDLDYVDALMDTYLAYVKANRISGMAWGDLLRDKHLKDRLQLQPLLQALVLHHDTMATGGRKDSYDGKIIEAVGQYALRAFIGDPDVPKDPLSLSEDEVCKIYHQHHNKSLPCYKTRKLPTTSE